MDQGTVIGMGQALAHEFAAQITTMPAATTVGSWTSEAKRTYYNLNDEIRLIPTVFLGSIASYRGRIMHRFVVACAISCVTSADIALAQAPTNIQGNWVAKTADCGDLNLKITGQSRSGAITGSMECVRTGQATRFGQTLIAGKQLTGKFDGAYVKIEGPQSLTSLKLEGRKLVGFAYGGPGLGTTPVAFTKR